MDAVLQLVFNLLAQALPSLGTANAQLIEKIIAGLVTLTPLLIKEYKAVLPMIQNVIIALKANTAITVEQWTALDVIEQQIDADFEAAATKAIEEDKAASQA